jgi:hypothetical protein
MLKGLQVAPELLQHRPRCANALIVMNSPKPDFFGQVQSSCRSGGAPQLGLFSERTREGEASMYHFLSVCMEASLQWICEYIASNLDRKIRLETLAEMGRLCVQHQSIRLPPHC